MAYSSGAKTAVPRVAEPSQRTRLLGSRSAYHAAGNETSRVHGGSGCALVAPVPVVSYSVSTVYATCYVAP